MKFSDAPESNLQFPKEMMHKVMHCALEVENIQLMASDYLGEHPFQQGNNFAVSIDTADEEQAFSVFSSLSEGGQVLMLFEEAFWGGKFGMLVDKYGVNWMLSLVEGDATT